MDVLAVTKQKDVLYFLNFATCSTHTCHWNRLLEMQPGL